MHRLLRVRIAFLLYHNPLWEAKMNPEKKILTFFLEGIANG